MLGTEHASTAQTLNNLGILAHVRGDYSASRKYLEEALSICQKVLGIEHTGTAGTLINLGILARNQGDYPAAQVSLLTRWQFTEKSLATNM